MCVEVLGLMIRMRTGVAAVSVAMSFVALALVGDISLLSGGGRDMSCHRSPGHHREPGYIPRASRMREGRVNVTSKSTG